MSAVPLVKCLGWVCAHGSLPFCTLRTIRVWLLGSVCVSGLIFIFALSSGDPKDKNLSRRTIKLLLLHYWFLQLRASRSLVPWVTLSPAQFHTAQPHSSRIVSNILNLIWRLPLPEMYWSHPEWAGDWHHVLFIFVFWFICLYISCLHLDSIYMTLRSNGTPSHRRWADTDFCDS